MKTITKYYIYKKKQPKTKLRRHIGIALIRKLLLTTHPDKTNQDASKYFILRKAYEVLTAPSSKAEYDQWLQHREDIDQRFSNMDAKSQFLAQDLLLREKQPKIIPLKRVIRDRYVSEETNNKRLGLEVYFTKLGWGKDMHFTSCSIKALLNEFGTIDRVDTFDTKAIVYFKFRESAIKASQSSTLPFTLKLINNQTAQLTPAEHHPISTKSLSDMENEIFSKIKKFANPEPKA